VTLTDVLAMVAEFRTRDAQTPVVLMGYLNPMEVMGYEVFAEAAAKAGVDGVLTVDMPPDEGHDLKTVLDDRGLDAIFLVAPTSTGPRLSLILAAASGFVYYVSLKGVTGAANLDVDAVAAKLAEIRAVTDLPIGVGFGIRDGATAAAVARVADAVVVGSALVRQMGELADDPFAIPGRLSEVLAEMRSAMDAQ
ncbi:MAG: tryptophan synthase subunit alpha, partial [Gammaproteobacteria bacterium]